MTFRVDLRRSLVLGAVVALTMAAAAIPAGAEDDEFPLPVTHQVKGLPLAGVAGTS
jgi:hypothetical protein